jgi:hypothetical protein
LAVVSMFVTGGARPARCFVPPPLFVLRWCLTGNGEDCFACDTDKDGDGDALICKRSPPETLVAWSTQQKKITSFI